MSKRRGDVVLLDELMDLIGIDAARWYLTSRSHDQTIELDIDLAREQSGKNPVYYVQYAHARIAAIERGAGERAAGAAPDATLPPEPSEAALVRAIAEFPRVAAEAADLRSPHRIAAYSYDLAAAFHVFYRDCRVLDDADAARTRSRLALIRAARGVLASSLDLLGVDCAGGDVSEVMRTDVAVIGGGAGAWTAMRVARSLGKRVVLFEDHHLGGTCVNVGCIPTKALVRAAEVVETIRHATRYGVAVEGFRVDFHAVMSRVNGIVQTSRSFYERAVAADPDTIWVNETVHFTSPTRLEWAGGAVEADRIIVASGTEAWWPPVPGIQEVGIDSTGILELDSLPDRLVIAGSGVISTEFAQIFARLGSKVTLICRNPQILRGTDQDAVAVIERALKRDGVRILHGTHALEARRHSGGWQELDIVRSDGEPETLYADAMLIATGRVPKVSGLDLAAAGIQIDPKTSGPLVDGELRTTNPRAWALGDAVGRQLYTHVANHEGPIAAKNALLDAHIVADFYDQVPGAVFCDPELAVVGLRSDEAAAQGFDAVTGTYPMTRNGKARAIGRDDGFVRMVVERGTRRILGATLVLPRRGERAAGDPRRDGGRRDDRPDPQGDPHTPDDRRGRQRMCARARAAALNCREHRPGGETRAFLLVKPV